MLGAERPDPTDLTDLGLVDSQAQAQSQVCLHSISLLLGKF